MADLEIIYHEYSDEDVIKALEICTADGGGCEECCYRFLGVGDCVHAMDIDALDLIKRQRAEIADLQDENKGLKETNEHLSGEYIALSKEKDNLIRTYAECQKEAIKEFAEKVKEKMNNLSRMEYDCTPYFLVSKSFIDTLVKEMTGENSK